MKKILAATLMTVSVVGCTTSSEPETLGEATQGLAVAPTSAADGVDQEIPVKLKVGSWDLLNLEIVLEPGDVIPWHYHYGLVDVIVTAGTASHEHTDGTFVDYPAGTGFIESKCTLHQFVNRGATASTIQVHFIKPRGAAPLVVVSGPDVKVSDPLCKYPSDSDHNEH